MTRGRRKAMKLKGEARNKANTQSTARKCLHSCCGWATDLILSFRAATQRRKMITYKTTSVHMIKINQEKGTIPGRETGDIFTVGPHQKHHNICSNTVTIVLGCDRTPHLPPAPPHPTCTAPPHPTSTTPLHPTSTAPRDATLASGRHGGESGMIWAFKGHTIFGIR